MKKKRESQKIENLIFITGLGGSGSRLLGMICQKLGFNLGTHLNESLDNTVFFKKSNYYGSINPNKEDHYPRFKRKFLSQLVGNYNTKTVVIKEPNFHIFIPFLLRISRDTGHSIKFIHIIRDPLYMINSKNQNQFSKWNYLFPISAKRKKFQRLEFWYYSNQKALSTLKEANANYLVVDYDCLTSGNNAELLSILDFLNKKTSLKEFESFISKIAVHKSRTFKTDINEIPKKYHHMIKNDF